MHSLPDKIKTDLLKELSIKLIRITNSDFEEDYESVVIYLEDNFKDRAKSLGIDFSEFPA